MEQARWWAWDFAVCSCVSGNLTSPSRLTTTVCKWAQWIWGSQCHSSLSRGLALIPQSLQYPYSEASPAATLPPPILSWELIYLILLICLHVSLPTGLQSPGGSGQCLLIFMSSVTLPSTKQRLNTYFAWLLLAFFCWHTEEIQRNGNGSLAYMHL